MPINYDKENTDIRAFQQDGYLLVKNFFKQNDCIDASNWLKKQDNSKLAKSWTEKEPAVELAVYSVIHEGDTPI